MIHNSSMARPPDEVPSSDPGDETARRFRYQWTYAAVICCALLDDTEGLKEVFCEHHEDILLRHVDGTFSGIQVKTRDQDQGPWKTNDDGVRNSLRRFVSLENEFPGSFKAFPFLTNNPLYRGKNSRDLVHVLATIHKAIVPGDLDSTVRRVVARAASDAGCSLDTAFAALKKTYASDALPKLADVLIRLADTLTDVWDEANRSSSSEVRGAAIALADACARASSLSHADTLPGYLPAVAAGTSLELARRVEAKRLDRQKVTAILVAALASVAPLEGPLEGVAPPGAGTVEMLRAKLEAGGLSAVSMHSAEDLRDKATYLALRWLQQHGMEGGMRRYQHVQSIALAEAAAALEESRSGGEPFGSVMLARLRERLAERSPQEVYGASRDHLVGFAFGLTAQCLVQWSLARPWEVA